MAGSPMNPNALRILAAMPGICEPTRDSVRADPDKAEALASAWATVDALAPRFAGWVTGRASQPPPAGEAESAQDWLATVEAAAALGCDAEWLQRIAPQVASKVPQAVVQIGNGKKRRHYRWSRAHLADVVLVADSEEPSAPKGHPGKGRRKRVTKGASREGKPDLRALVRQISGRG
jgi:hypothetical protein